MKKILFGPIVFKTLFICFISLFFVAYKVSAETPEKTPEAAAVETTEETPVPVIEEEPFIDETDWQEFLMHAAKSPVIFEGKTREVTVMPIGLAVLPMITFEDMQFLKGESLTEKTFPMPGKIQPEKLEPGRTWFAALQKIQDSGNYEIKLLAFVSDSRRQNLKDFLTELKRKSEESAPL